MFSQQITHKRLSPARPLVLALFFVSFSIALKPLFAQMTPLEQKLQTIHQQRINAQNSLTPDVNLINSLRNQEQQLLDLVTQLRVQSQKLGGMGGGPPGGQSGMGAGGPGQTMMMTAIPFTRWTPRDLLAWKSLASGADLDSLPSPTTISRRRD